MIKKNILLLLVGIVLCGPAWAADEQLKPDYRGDTLRPTASGAVTNDEAKELRNLRVDPVTSGLLVVDGATLSGRKAVVPKYLSGYFVSEDSAFTAGDSPAAIDINATLGRNAEMGYIACDGSGDVQVRLSESGSSFGATLTIKAGEVFSIDGMNVDTISVVHVGTDSAYRVFAR